MAKQKFCQDCNQRHGCQEVYRRLGNTKGPSVVIKAITAFLLPVMVFIAALAAFEWVLAKTSPHQFFSCLAFESFLTKNWCGAKELLTALSFLLALATTSVCVLIIKVINARFSKNK